MKKTINVKKINKKYINVQNVFEFYIFRYHFDNILTA